MICEHCHCEMVVGEVRVYTQTITAKCLDGCGFVTVFNAGSIDPPVANDANFYCWMTSTAYQGNANGFLNTKG